MCRQSTQTCGNNSEIFIWLAGRSDCVSQLCVIDRYYQANCINFVWASLALQAVWKTKFTLKSAARRHCLQTKHDTKSAFGYLHWYVKVFIPITISVETMGHNKVELIEVRKCFVNSIIQATSLWNVMEHLIGISFETIVSISNWSEGQLRTYKIAEDRIMMLTQQGRYLNIREIISRQIIYKNFLDK